MHQRFTYIYTHNTSYTRRVYIIDYNCTYVYYIHILTSTYGCFPGVVKTSRPVCRDHPEAEWKSYSDSPTTPICLKGIQRRQMKNYLSTYLSTFSLERPEANSASGLRINFIYASNYCNILIYHSINYIYLSISLSIHLFIYPSVQLCFFSIHATHRDSPIHLSIYSSNFTAQKRVISMHPSC